MKTATSPEKSRGSEKGKSPKRGEDAETGDGLRAGSDPTAEVEEVLRRSAGRIHPSPSFVERLAVRLRHARMSRTPQRAAPPRRLWFAWAGGAVALLLAVALIVRSLPTGVPAHPLPAEPTSGGAPAAETPTTQVGGTAVLETQVPDTVTPPVPTPVPTEPPYVAGLPPAVVTAMPGNGEEVTLQAGILLRFTQPMDRASVERALTVTPAVTGTFTWHDDETVTFQPKVLASATRYRVALGQDAQSTGGTSITGEMAFAFSTVGPLEVTHTTPSAGAVDLRGDTPLLLAFNYPVVPVNCTGQAATSGGLCAPLPLEITPPVSGQGMWVNSSVYRFDPTPAWSAGTHYTVALSTTVSAAGGAALEAPVSISFSTSEPRVQHVSPFNGTENVPLEGAVRVTFNTPMAPEATEAAFSMSSIPDGPITGGFGWEDAGATLVFTPTTLLTPETTYDVEIDTTARSLDGGVLAAGRQSDFTTVPALRVAQISPGSDAKTGRLAYYESVQIKLEGLLDPATTTDKVRVTEEGAGTVDANVYWDAYSDQPGAWVSWDKKAGVRYCVTVLPGLADRYGNTLTGEAQACFTVDNAPPIFAPVARYDTLTLDGASPAEVYFTAVNVQQLTLDVGTLQERDFVGYQDNWSLQSSWQVAVSPDGQLNRTAAVPVQLANGEALPTGFYGVMWRTPGSTNSQAERLRVAVVDLHVLLKVGPDEALVWVTDLRTAQPVAGASVRILSTSGTLLGRGLSDADGIARLAIPTQSDRWEAYTAVAGEPGQAGFGIARSDWNYDVAPWAFGVTYDYSRPPAYRGYLQTDRPIYRPGQTVYFRGILRNDDDGRYSLPEPGMGVQVALTSWSDNGTDTVEAVVSDAGTFDGAFDLPADAQLGSYSLSLRTGEGTPEIAGIQVAVAAYRKPEFEVTVVPERADQLDGEMAHVAIQASYYSGGGVSKAPVHWTVRAGPYSFSPDVSGWWQWGANTMSWEPWREPEVVTEGDGVTDAEGRLVMTLPLDLAPLSDQDTVGPQRWEVEATVTDDTGFPVTQSGSLTVHTSRFYLGLKPQSWVSTAGKPALVDLLALDWDEQPVADQHVRATLARRTWTYVSPTKPFASGTWTHKDTVVDTLNVTTDGTGTATLTFTPPTSGSYVVQVESTDANGNTARSETYLWVGGPQTAAWQLGEGKVEPVADAESYRPGDVAHILLSTPFSGPFEVLMTIERGTILEVKHLTVREANPLIDVPITEAHVPNIVVSFAVVKGVDADQATPDVRLGMVELTVEPVRQTLDVTVTPVCAAEERDAGGRCTYAPGDPGAGHRPRARRRWPTCRRRGGTGRRGQGRVGSG